MSTRQARTRAISTGASHRAYATCKKARAAPAVQRHYAGNSQLRPKTLSVKASVHASYTG